MDQNQVLESLVARLVEQIVAAIIRLLTGPFREEMHRIAKTAVETATPLWWGAIYLGVLGGWLLCLTLICVFDRVKR